MTSSISIKFLLWFTENFSFFLAIVAQLISLWLPLQLRSWDDDLLNVLTYSTIQVMVALVLFVWIPSAFDLYELSLLTEFALILMVFVGSWMRALRIIPLEFTYPVLPDMSRGEGIRFTEFTSPERIRALSEVSAFDPKSIEKIIQIKEKLSKKRPEKVQVKGQLPHASTGEAQTDSGGST